MAAANDRLFAKFAKVLGHPEWAHDVRYKTNSDRYAHKTELLNNIGRVMLRRTSQEWLVLLEAAGLPCSRIHTLQQAMEHPQTLAVDILQSDPQSGVTVCRLPLRFDKERPPIFRFAPEIGEHNLDLLGEQAQPIDHSRPA